MCAALQELGLDKIPKSEAATLFPGKIKYAAKLHLSPDEAARAAAGQDLGEDDDDDDESIDTARINEGILEVQAEAVATATPRGYGAGGAESQLPGKLSAVEIS